MCYNHRNHAGNAGDVWKHLILAEVSAYLLAEEKNLVYVESHVGYPKYSLETPGEWQDGIGECWKRLDVLKELSYFDILDRLNPTGLRIYPGSSLLVLMASAKAGLCPEADVWDTSLEVAASWHDAHLPGSDKFRFHLGDGFSGVGSLMDRSRPGLLLIDPPYLESRDIERVCALLEKAARSGWTVLCWRMADVDALLNARPEISCRVEMYSVNFSDVGMSCGKWRGATMILAGSDDLKGYVNQSARNFLGIMHTQNLFKVQNHVS
jgi:23S rRNA (adenine2030-N6)-methyltransferase